MSLKIFVNKDARYYIEHFPGFLKPNHEWGPARKARVMVADGDWTEVAAGLLEGRYLRGGP